MIIDSTTPKLTATERDNLFAAIGQIVVNFQQIELWLSEALTSLLSLKPEDDRHLISSAMSFTQKIDLLVILYPRKHKHPFKTDIKIIKKALYTAEKFRNQIVHSLWTVDFPGKWVRVKGSIKGRKGFALSTSPADVAHLEDAAKALITIRAWELVDCSALQEAIDILENI